MGNVKPSRRLNNEAIIRTAVYRKLRDEGYSRCIIATPLYLRAFRQDGSLRVYRANKGNHRHYFLEIRRAYRGISAKVQEARRVLQQAFNRTVLFLEIQTTRQGQLVIKIHE